MRRVKQTASDYVQAARAAWGRLVRRQVGMAGLLGLVLCMSIVGTAAATQTSTSPHYSVSETQFGTGSIEHQCSTNYCAKSSTGDTAVGSTSSDNYSAQAGSNTNGDPRLDVSVTPNGSQDLGTLDNTQTGATSATIDVRIYNSNGYNLLLSGAAPSQGTHTITALTTPGYSQQGQEQFGVNMVTNTSPSIGAAATKQPSGDSAVAYLADDYKTTNMFKYVPGDVLASCPDNGEAVYTLSMIMNVSNVTPGGRYTGAIAAIVVPVF
ncbi:MAG TPA: hypothetical protein VLF59_03875 [Candidatus Saccharimonadales bacterium]|nr:hypothetical protein [Candidatus Saccharimonadales bacterium]